MPYTQKQHRLFAAAAHDPKIAKSHGMSQSAAKRLMKEPIKKGPGTKVLMAGKHK